MIAGSCAAQTLVFEATSGAGGKKHVVLISGDEEYRSEESCPMLAKILNRHHGFKTTVLFAIHPNGGYIDSNYQNNIPGMGAIQTADVVIIGTRFRDLPDNQLQPLLDHWNAGKPVIGFRTATHAFRGESRLGGLSWNQFGLKILGQDWGGHYGKHKKQGARGVIVETHQDHPILRSVADVFADSDVYGVEWVTEKNATILLMGQVTETLLPDSAPVEGKQLQPSSWLKEYTMPESEKTGTVFVRRWVPQRISLAKIYAESSSMRRISCRVWKCPRRRMLNSWIHLIQAGIPSTKAKIIIKI
ncbi:MAG: hypothetical protein ABGX16_23260 [Pirellulales bacterium]